MRFFKSVVLMFCVIGALGVSVFLYTEHQDTKEVRLIPREALFDNPQRIQVRMSPDGTKFAYLAPDEKNILNVWMRDLEHPDRDIKITQDTKRGIRNFLWQFDQSHILYVQDQDGDENWHLYQTDINTHESKDLTPYDGAQVNIIKYDPKFPNKMLITLNKRDPTLHDVYRLDLETGEIVLDTENPGDVLEWIADHNLNVRLTQSYTNDGSICIRTRETDSSTGNSIWQELLTTNAEEITEGIYDFAADNNTFYLLSSIGGDTVRLLQVDATSGAKNLLIEDQQFDVSDIVLNPINHNLEYVTVEKELPQRIIVDSSLEGDFATISKSIQGLFSLTSRDLNNQKWIIATISDVKAPHYYLYDRKTQDLTLLFASRPVLEEYTLSEMKPITYQARDGMQLYGYLTLPAGKAPQHLPSVLLVHGGPWVRDDWGFNPLVQWLANRGYAVLQINYRGSSGFGKKYLNAGNREWAGKMHTDLLDGKAWMIQEGFADPDKVAIYGGSYGGYATLVGLTFTPEEFCCGVDIVGPSNLITLLQTLPPYWNPAKAEMDLRVGNLDTDKDFLQGISPLFRAQNITKPLLIAQGAHDPRVKQAESDQIVEAMRQNGLPVEYMLFEDEGHGFARPENRLKFYAHAEAFLALYLGGRQE